MNQKEYIQMILDASDDDLLVCILIQLFADIAIKVAVFFPENGCKGSAMIRILMNACYQQADYFEKLLESKKNE